MTKKEIEGWRGFIELLAHIDSPKDIKALCDLFFTIEEKETLASRYLIIKALLEAKIPQRQIADQYHVSISQITRGSNALKIISPSLKKTLADIL